MGKKQKNNNNILLTKNKNKHRQIHKSLAGNKSNPNNYCPLAAAYKIEIA